MKTLLCASGRPGTARVLLQPDEPAGGTEWYVIEEETRAFEGTEGIEKSIQSLKRLLA